MSDPPKLVINPPPSDAERAAIEALVSRLSLDGCTPSYAPAWPSDLTHRGEASRSA
jgi:hypothetical protein